MTNNKNEADKDDKEKKKSNEKLNKLQEELEEVKEKRDEYLEGWKRTKADFENYKKKEQERLESFKKRSKENLIRELITILDSFDLSVLSSDDDKVEKKGVELIRGQLQNILKNNGMSIIETSIGDEFNPQIHEAVERVESDKEEGVIVEVIKAGYKFSEKVIRPSQVKVSKG